MIVALNLLINDYLYNPDNETEIRTYLTRFLDFEDWFLSGIDMCTLWAVLLAIPPLLMGMLLSRPFEYDLEPVMDKLSSFAKSCIDIWETSETYFDQSNSALYVKGYAKKFITSAPWSLLVYGPDNDGTTPERFCASEYLEARGKWSEWVANSQI